VESAGWLLAESDWASDATSGLQAKCEICLMMDMELGFWDGMTRCFWVEAFVTLDGVSFECILHMGLDA
jgi:hypothetical protein